MENNRKMINGVIFLEEQADYLLLLGKEGLYTLQAENDHWNVHYTLPGKTLNLDRQFISKDEALQDVYKMDIWCRNIWRFLPTQDKLKGTSHGSFIIRFRQEGQGGIYFHSNKPPDFDRSKVNPENEPFSRKGLLKFAFL